LKILFDEGVPWPLAGLLNPVTVDRVQSIGLEELRTWSPQARRGRWYDLIVTTDKNLKHQQNLKGLRLKIYELPITSWPQLRSQTEKIGADIAELLANRGDFEFLNVDE
jgi:hypothetical protein